MPGINARITTTKIAMFKYKQDFSLALPLRNTHLHVICCIFFYVMIDISE